MQIKVLISVIALLLLLYSVSAVTECTDSDGNNPYQKGTVTFLNDYEDYCYDATRLREWLCDGEMTFEWYDCQAGCSDGACLPYCGNNVCDNGEDCRTCAMDCGACCGNGVFDEGENCKNCPEDMTCSADEVCTDGRCVTKAYCGDGVCGDTENCESCVADCGCSPEQQCVNKSCAPKEGYVIYYLLFVLVAAAVVVAYYVYYKRQRLTKPRHGHAPKLMPAPPLPVKVPATVKAARKPRKKAIRRRRKKR